MSLIGNILSFVLIAFAAGWTTGKIFKKRGFGTIGNFVVGVSGCLIGSLCFNLLGFQYHGFIASFIVALFGAIVLVYIIKFGTNL